MVECSKQLIFKGVEMKIKLNDGKVVIPEKGYLEISHGTLRSQDLLPCFLEAIRETPEYEQLMANDCIPSHIWEDESAEWWDSEECSYLINEELFDILQGMSLDGYYFGTSEGDGSAFGWWKEEEF